MYRISNQQCTWVPCVVFFSLQRPCFVSLQLHFLVVQRRARSWIKGDNTNNLPRTDLRELFSVQAATGRRSNATGTSETEVTGALER